MRFRAFFAIFALAAAAQAQPAFQVRDINPQPVHFVLSGQPHDLTPTQGKLFFRIGSEFEAEIWATDGTPGGTLRLPDPCSNESDCLRPGPYLVGSLRNLALWVGRTPRAEEVLWRSDGTWAGTFPLHDPEAVRASSPDWGEQVRYAVTGGFALFTACTDEHGCELWRTNGTREGTRLLKDIEPGSRGSGPIWLTRVGDRVFFIASGGSGDSPALWVSNGTAAGTVRLRQFPDSSHFFPWLLASAGGKLFFTAAENDGAELWVSDGTVAGTRAVSKFAPPGPFAQTLWLKPIGNRVYFLADDVEHGTELWRSDGTATGTVRVTEFGYHKPFGIFDTIAASQIEAAGERIVFLATDGVNDWRYWSTSGTPESTLEVADPCPPTGCAGTRPEEPPSWPTLAAAGDRAVLRKYDEDFVIEAWGTDGTPGGTVRLLDAPMWSHPVALSRVAFFRTVGGLWRTDGTPEGTYRFAEFGGIDGPEPDTVEIVSYRGKVYVNAPGLYGYGIWASDGRPGGTALATSPLPGPQSGSSPHELTASGGQLLFLAHNGEKLDLWRSAGTPESTAALGVSASVSQDGSSSCPSFWPTSSFRLVAGKVYYLRQDPSSCRLILWVTDGTAAGTVQLPAYVLILESTPPLVEHQGSVFFIAAEQGPSSVNTFIWKSDGTPQGTGRAFDLSAGADSLTSLGPDLYFAALDPEFRRQLWVSDGTAAGTKRLTDFQGEDIELAPVPQLTRVGGTVFFQVATFGQARELWATDGTPAGTRRIRAGGSQALTAFKGALYFLTEDGRVEEAPWSLWRSDGTAAGTVPVQSIGFYDGFWDIEPTIVGDELFFVMSSEDHGNELWKTDGTASGTRQVRDIFPGSASSFPAGLTAAGGKLYFRADDGLHGIELWESDGTEAGTRMVHDIQPLSGSSSPAELTPVGNLLFFRADDGVTGSELWALPLGPDGKCQPSPTNLCLGGGRFRVEAHWKDFSGNAGRGQAVALTPDTGYFWFFDPANVETIVKVLDGRGVNEHHWVFYGALSSVEYSITVTDIETGRTRRYFNPSGHIASVGDSTGFGPSWDQAEKAAFVAPAAVEPLVSGRTDPAAKVPCVANATRLCLNGNRFAVEVTWKDFSGNTGTGKAVGLTGDTGYFWFFDNDNVELVLKVLDGRPVNGKFWLFYGALSSVEYTITVTDTETGAVKTYKNPSGRLGSVGDTGAF